MGLYPYQDFGVRWLASRSKAYLADSPGLGKTPQAIRAAAMAEANNVLVISPASMVGTWQEEIKTWGAGPPYYWNVVSYGQLVRNPAVRRQIGLLHPDTVISDEAHYLKGASKRQKLVLALMKQPYVERKWFLSGTPTPNGPHELYTILCAMWPDRLQYFRIKNYTDWLNFSCQWTQGEYGPRIWGPNPATVQKLRILLFGSNGNRCESKGIMLRRRDEDVEADLPEIDLRRFPVRMPEPNAELTVLEDSVEDEELSWIEDGALPPSGGPLATLRRLTGEIKADLVGPILVDELREGGLKKLIVFAYHRNVLDKLHAYLQPFGVARLDGSTPTAHRTPLVKMFQSGQMIRVFLGQIQAGGVGITLTAASDVVIVEPSWVPEENSQAIRRIARIGQKEARVRARMVVLAGSLDEAITRVIIRKQTTVDTTIN